MTLRVASLHYYPVKGCRGRDASSLTIDNLGVVGDLNEIVPKLTELVRAKRGS